MNCCQTITAVILSCVIPVISLAQEANVTMEVIDSLDDLSTHHRIKLPNRNAVRDMPGVATDKSVMTQQERELHTKQLTIQRKQIDALITEAEGEKASSSVARQRELRQNRTGVAGIRNEVADRRLEFADEVKDGTDDIPATLIGTPALADPTLSKGSVLGNDISVGKDTTFEEDSMDFNK